RYALSGFDESDPSFLQFVKSDAWQPWQWVKDHGGSLHPATVRQHFHGMRLPCEPCAEITRGLPAIGVQHHIRVHILCHQLGLAYNVALIVKSFQRVARLPK